MQEQIFLLHIKICERDLEIARLRHKLYLTEQEHQNTPRATIVDVQEVQPITIVPAGAIAGKLPTLASMIPGIGGDDVSETPAAIKPTHKSKIVRKGGLWRPTWDHVTEMDMKGRPEAERREAVMLYSTQYPGISQRMIAKKTNLVDIDVHYLLTGQRYPFELKKAAKKAAKRAADKNTMTPPPVLRRPSADVHPLRYTVSGNGIVADLQQE